MLVSCKSHKLEQLGKGVKTQLREGKRREETSPACVHHCIRHLRIYTTPGCFQHSTTGNSLTSQPGPRHAAHLSFLGCPMEAPTYQVHVGEISPGLAVKLLRGGCHLGQDFLGVFAVVTGLHHPTLRHCALYLLIGCQCGVEGEGP